MSSLPVFATISKAFSFLGLNLRLLTVWTLFPLVLTLVTFGLGSLVAYLIKHWLPLVPCAVFTLFVWGPYSVRVNQQVVAGRTCQGGYLSQMFESPSVRYVGYSLLLMLINAVGLGLAAMPTIIAWTREAMGMALTVRYLSTLVSVGLALAFIIMIAPLNLICPAASVEDTPRLSTAYNLGARAKLRLFLIMALPQVLFTLLSSALDMAANAVGGGQGLFQNLVLLPAQLVLAFFGCIVNMAAPALAYRHLRGLPDPARVETGSDIPWPGPTI